MQTLVLIDGNSLLNRAFYATKTLTTKDGIPTNAVFGFIKLLLKLITDINPDKLIVAFDLKAPTFRHNMYQDYKATRKPMPEDLAVQINTLKSLLRSMNVCICEKEGFEADDLIGTLSHKFLDTKSIIVTGDKDSYQLVDSQTEVYLTKTGVSELLKLNSDNFLNSIGYRPDQVIEMKALMGDSSDNIPGVKGIGEKTALSLITKYSNLEGIYGHIEEISGSLYEKLQEGKDMAYLSRKLATIDRNVHLDINLDQCSVILPFSNEVYQQFLQLEFTSLLKLDIFENKENEVQKQNPAEKVSIQYITDKKSFLQQLNSCELFSVVVSGNDYHFYFNGIENIIKEQITLLDEGISAQETNEILHALFERKNGKAIIFSVKDLMHKLSLQGIDLQISQEDVSLMKYLTDYTGKDDDLQATLSAYGFDMNMPAYGIYCIYFQLKEKLVSEGLESLYRNIELPLTNVLFQMEKCGVKIDVKTSEILEKKYRDQISKITAEIYAQAGEEFNINSPLQLGKILFEKLKLPAPRKNKRGAYSTSADILEKLQDDYKIVKDVLRCRHFQKLLSTYIDGFKPLIDKKTGLVHTTYNQIQTTTGRLSSLNPNLQNIPVRDEEGRELRKLFVARSEERILVDADYSQIELRLLAHFSGCKELIEAYHSGQDIHALTASQVFGVPIEKVDSSQRRAAKAVNFGIIYGISEFGLAANLNISAKQARDYIKRYFEKYSDIKKYMDSNVDFAHKNEYVTTLLGRKRVIHEINSSNYNIRSFGERAAMNMPLQGSSADIIKIAMLRVYDRLIKEGLRSQLILQVHDELVIDAYESEQKQVIEILKYEMEHAAELKVPLIAEIHCGKNWYEAK